LHRSVEEPHAGDVERARDVLDLVHIRRTRALEPALRNPIERRHQRLHRAWKNAETGVAQRPRLGRILQRVQRRAAVAHVDDRNGGKGLKH
jgi:hypothetical protein